MTMKTRQRIFAIGDLHLGLGMAKGFEKPMDIFDEVWKDHHLKLAANWESSGVRDDDLVLICGDVSWAVRHEDFLPDFEFIRERRGKKVIICGNHDFWWNSAALLNRLDPNVFFMKNSFYKAENAWICGTRGWLSPSSSPLPPEDMKVFRREMGRLERSLSLAARDGADRIIVMLHYPPFDERLQKNEFAELISAYPVVQTVFGHIHGVRSFPETPGFRLVTADYLGFCPVLLE